MSLRSVMKHFVFQPPTPPSYELSQLVDVSELSPPPPAAPHLAQTAAACLPVSQCRSDFVKKYHKNLIIIAAPTGGHIVTLRFVNPKSRGITVIYSHLSYLTSEQALADLARFIEYISSLTKESALKSNPPLKAKFSAANSKVRLGEGGGRGDCER